MHAASICEPDSTRSDHLMRNLLFQRHIFSCVFGLLDKCMHFVIACLSSHAS